MYSIKYPEVLPQAQITYSFLAKIRLFVAFPPLGNAFNIFVNKILKTQSHLSTCSIASPPTVQKVCNPSRWSLEFIFTGFQVLMVLHYHYIKSEHIHPGTSPPPFGPKSREDKGGRVPGSVSWDQIWTISELLSGRFPLRNRHFRTLKMPKKFQPAAGFPP